MKCFQKMIDDNYIRMMRIVLNKSSKQHPIKEKTYGHLPQIKKIQERQTMHDVPYRRYKDELKSDILLWTIKYEMTSVNRTAKANNHLYRPNVIADKER